MNPSKCNLNHKQFDALQGMAQFGYAWADSWPIPAWMSAGHYYAHPSTLKALVSRGLAELAPTSAGHYAYQRKAWVLTDMGKCFMGVE